MRVEAGQREMGVSELAVRLAELEKRIERLEQRAPARSTLTAVEPKTAVITASELDEEKDLALFGGTLIGIGGGFLLRALTESHILPSLAGVALGVAYAFAWIWVADRHARRGQLHAATFDAVVMAAVVFPLSWEVSVRFNVIPPAVALLLTILAAGALLFIGWHRNVPSFAWIAVLAGSPCIAAIALGDARVAVPLLCLTLIGAAIWWAARDRKWLAVSVPVPLAIAVMSGVAAMIASDAHSHDSPALIAIALCGSFLLYAGTLTARTLLTGTDLSRWDLIAIAPGALVTIGSAAYLASHFAAARPAVPLLFAIAATAAYALAIRSASTLPMARTAFASVGFICAIAASAIVLTPAAAGILWSLFAVAFAMTAVPQLMLHSAAYAFVAIAASGLLKKSLTLISGIGGTAQLRTIDIVTIAIIGSAALLTLMRRESEENALARGSRIALLALTVFIGAAGAARAFVALAATDAASSATARSAAIAVVAVSLVFIARMQRFRELSMLVYPMLCVGAAKFVTDDFIGGRAATLFATLAIYGMALLVVAKFRRAQIQSGTKEGLHKSHAV